MNVSGVGAVLVVICVQRSVGDGEVSEEDETPQTVSVVQQVRAIIGGVAKEMKAFFDSRVIEQQKSTAVKNSQVLRTVA